MRYLSVCSGIEAATCAWHPLGWQPEAFSEIEAFPASVLAHHYPAVPNRGDMTKFKDWHDAAIDLLVGGTPCQSFSVAGLRKGLADPRGNLMLTYLAIAQRYAPRGLVWENVPGVLSSNGGRDFGTLLGGLAELGYGFAYRVLDAQYVRVESHARAVPQRRRRVFVVGHLGDWRRAAAVLFERESLLGYPAPSRGAGERTAATLTRGAESSGKGGYAGRRQEDDVNIVVAGTLQAADGSATQQDAEAGLLVAHYLRAEGFDASEDGTGRGTPLVPVPFDTTQITSKANYSNPRPGDPCHPLAAGAHAPAVAYTTKMHNTKSNNAGKLFEERSPCLDANSPAPALLKPSQVRRLTPRECERLQGFPDGYTDILSRGKPAADGPRYKALGNSMAVNVMRWIGERIAAIEAMEIGRKAA
ncbi:DNA cytosine methyltransferase [Cupriavidus necator]|uniref:DNA cytosine methyltransferase n=1 Tax=Cupriavidus necator TaxID=106590 RepID=UPI003ECF8FC3